MRVAAVKPSLVARYMHYTFKHLGVQNLLRLFGFEQL